MKCSLLPTTHLKIMHQIPVFQYTWHCHSHLVAIQWDLIVGSQGYFERLSPSTGRINLGIQILQFRWGLGLICVYQTWIFISEVFHSTTFDNDKQRWTIHTKKVKVHASLLFQPLTSFGPKRPCSQEIDIISEINRLSWRAEPQNGWS